MKFQKITAMTFSAVLSLSTAIWGASAIAQPAGQGVAASDSMDFTSGEIRKVDKAAAKLTIKHGPIRSLDMPSMTMVYQVRDAALLEKVKAGDRVRFHALEEGGKFIVTDIQLGG